MSKGKNDIHSIYIYLFYTLYSYNSISPDMRNVKYLPIFHCSYSMTLLFFSLIGMRVFLNIFLVIQNTDFFIQISKMSIVSISSIE